MRIQETRPISKTKRWRLLEILERRQVAEVRPIDLESDAEVIADEQAAGEEVAETETSEPAEDEPEDQEPVADNQDTEDSEE